MGKRGPQAKTIAAHPTTVRFEVDLLQQLQQSAEARGLTVSEEIKFRLRWSLSQPLQWRAPVPGGYI